MGRRNKRDDGGKKQKPQEQRPGFWKSLKEETRNSIIGIILIVLTLILLVAATGRGGFIGTKFYNGFHFLFGIGYYLIPIVTLILGINFSRASKAQLTTPSLIASPFFVLSGLGFISYLGNLTNSVEGITVQNSLGGFVGFYIMKPLIFLFAPLLTSVVLGSILLISLIVLFDAPLHLGIFRAIASIFPKREKMPDEDLATLKITGGGKEDIPANTEVLTPPAHEVTEPEPEQKTVVAPPPPKIERGERADIPFQFNPALHEAYTTPPLSLLSHDKGKAGSGDAKANANIIKRTLQNYGVDVEMDEVIIGPSITRYSLKPAESVRLSKVVQLQRELEYALAIAPIRIEAPIPGKSLVGIEVPNTQKSTVGLASLLSEEVWGENPNPLFVPLGKGIAGVAHFMNIAKMPHVLIAGATGSGKSVTIHTIITSLLYRNSPEQLRFIMVDPKRVELTLYNGIPHLLTPVITDPRKTILTLKWATKEMERRYEVLQKEKCRDISSYHKTILTPALAKAEKDKEKGVIDPENPPVLPELMPNIVIIIDELADIMQAYPRELEAAIVRLAAMSRAVGIHLIIATQSPRVNVITGLIKANVPARVALQVASQIDSRTILDMGGAENLLGAGDMLFLAGDMPKPARLQSAFISEEEVKNVVKFLKNNYDGTAGEEINIGGENGASSFDISGDSLSDDEEDDKYEEARAVVIQTQKASTSYLQRKLGVGYSRAAKLVDILEERGVVGPGEGSKPRQVLVKNETTLPEGFGTEAES